MRITTWNARAATRRLAALVFTASAGGVLLGMIARAAPSAAERPDLSPETLRKAATHVVVGKVAQVWTREESKHRFDFIRYVAEIAVEEVEKGEGLAPGQLVYARYWEKSWGGGGPPPDDAYGHRGLPSPGDRVRVHLACDAHDGFEQTADHGFNVIGPNGFAEP